MNPGNQPFTEADYNSFLDDMTPFLKLGATINMAIEDAGLQKHRTAIYAKYSLNDDFAEKIKAFREYPGKIANYILVRRVMLVNEKIKQGLPVNEEEMKDVRFVAEKHRSSFQYFAKQS